MDNMAFEEGVTHQEEQEDDQEGHNEYTEDLSGIIERDELLSSNHTREEVISRIKTISGRINIAINDYLNEKRSAKQHATIVLVLILAVIEFLSIFNICDIKSLKVLIAGILSIFLSQSHIVLTLIIIFLVAVLLLQRSTALRRIIILFLLFAALAYFFYTINSEYISHSESILQILFNYIYDQPQISSMLLFLLLILPLIAWRSMLQRKAISALAIIFAFIAPIGLGLIMGKFDLQTMDVFLANFSAILFSLFQYFGILLLLSLIWILIAWISEDEGLVVLPFKVANAENAYDGKAISDLLVAELDRIIRIYPRKNIWSARLSRSGPNISILDSTTNSRNAMPQRFESTLDLYEILPSLSTESISSSISSVGSVNVGGTTLSIGLFLVTLKRLCPLGNPGSIITGSLQKYGSKVCLIAHKENLGNKLHAGRSWKICHDVTNDEEIPELIKDIAFMIIFDLSKSIKQERDNTWLGFKHFTEAFDSYNRYILTGNIDDLQMARVNCIHASDVEKGNMNLIQLFRILGNAYSRNGDEGLAENLIQRAIDLARMSEGD